MNLTPLTHPSSYQNLWNDPAVESRIAAGIEAYRKSDGSVRVTGTVGAPRPGVRVKVSQQDSSFRFGANIFKLDGYESREMNQRYEEAFYRLFNGATVPFYWKTLEPEPGRLRFGADSPPAPRRPPPDVVVDFCQRHGLRMHGHTLVWEFLKWSMPDWLPRDPAQTERLIEKRIREIAERYRSVIQRWDVLNEPVAGYSAEQVHPMPANYERKAFAMAARYFPKDARLDINETTGYWYPHKKAYADLIRRLLADGARIGAIGLQFHLFADQDMARVLLGELFPPRQLLEALDLYGAFGLPVHVSEITLTSPDKSPAGLEAQADAARKYYRLWFSHPAVEGITWWNVPDGGAAPGEDKVYSGLLFDDLTPKPSYHVLRQLLHEEWRTETEQTTDATGTFHFRGFHGTYRLRTGAGIESTMTLAPGQPNQATICL